MNEAVGCPRGRWRRGKFSVLGDGLGPSGGYRQRPSAAWTPEISFRRRLPGPRAFLWARGAPLGASLVRHHEQDAAAEQAVGVDAVGVVSPRAYFVEQRVLYGEGLLLSEGVEVALEPEAAQQGLLAADAYEGQSVVITTNLGSAGGDRCSGTTR